MLYRLWRDVLLNGLVAGWYVPRKGRWLLLRWLGLDVEPAHIYQGVWFSGKKVKIGRGAMVNRGCFFNASALVTLEPRVNVGMECMFIAGSHELGPASRRAGPLTNAPITVGAGSWLAARVTVMPGVTIGEGCVIAAGAVVTKDCEPHSLYAGVPAKLVRRLDEVPSTET